MPDFILFLQGTYRSDHLEFYRHLCRGRMKVAVDGGYRFFQKVGLVPDALIGDFDSLKRMPRELPAQTEVVRYPIRKDKTDTHLALEYALARGGRRIDIVVPQIGEPDHFLGNVMLLNLTSAARQAGGRADIRLVNYSYDIRLLRDGVVSFTDAVDDVVSVIPLSKRIRLTTQGMEYNAVECLVRLGETLPLRNRVQGGRARIRIVGRALVVRQFRR